MSTAVEERLLESINRLVTVGDRNNSSTQRLLEKIIEDNRDIKKYLKSTQQNEESQSRLEKKKEVQSVKVENFQEVVGLLPKYLKGAFSSSQPAQQNISSTDSKGFGVGSFLKSLLGVGVIGGILGWLFDDKNLGFKFDQTGLFGAGAVGNLGAKLSEIFVGKFLGKGAGKLVGSSLRVLARGGSFIGSLISLYFANEAYKKGDWKGTLIELGAAVAPLLDLLIPGAGSALAMGLAVWSAYRDISGQSTADAKRFEQEGKDFWDYFEEQLENLGESVLEAVESILHIVDRVVTSTVAHFVEKVNPELAEIIRKAGMSDEDIERKKRLLTLKINRLKTEQKRMKETSVGESGATNKSIAEIEIKKLEKELESFKTEEEVRKKEQEDSEKVKKEITDKWKIVTNEDGARDEIVEKFKKQEEEKKKKKQEEWNKKYPGGWMDWFSKMISPIGDPEIRRNVPSPNISPEGWKEWFMDSLNFFSDPEIRRNVPQTKSASPPPINTVEFQRTDTNKSTDITVAAVNKLADQMGSFAKGLHSLSEAIIKDNKQAPVLIPSPSSVQGDIKTAAAIAGNSDITNFRTETMAFGPRPSGYAPRVVA